ncbi:GAF domain-containing protein [Domibacillus sp. PGB-M46]|uniref:GAF domain-containing protein n=1 Tax=Domibacillus sp. PGB-M46 TaxID=2910255 RepID=UPI001F55CFC3|nr:GAF domain-containing protein [Domibacillus sp. PGB-M46]MCI2257005.1 GAF domain-containing protein [Domibacillus sp. PGB-M46]
MDEINIAQSLEKFIYRKEIKKTLSHIEPGLKNHKDLSTVFFSLYEKGIIGEDELAALQTKFMLNQFISLMEHHFKELSCGIYIHDENEKKMWNGAVKNVSPGYNEYSRGLSTVNDILDGDEIPVYSKHIVAIPDLERGEDITSLNHKKELLKNGYQAVCCSPLTYRGHIIGHSVMYSESKRIFTAEEINMFSMYMTLIEEKLAEIKNHLLPILKNAK